MTTIESEEYDEDSCDLTPSSEQGVAVVGSSTYDYTFFSEKLDVNEFNQAQKIEKQYGGKGANQAIMVAKLALHSRIVVFVGAVGEDEEGKEMRANFEKHKLLNVNKHLRAVHGVPSSVCTTIVNSTTLAKTTVFYAGSNNHVTKEMIDNSWDDIKLCKVLLTQLEIPLEITQYALKRAKEQGISTILNSSGPMLGSFLKKWDEIAPLVDLLVLNSEELFQIVQHISNNEFEETGNLIASVKAASEYLASKGFKRIVTKCGEFGSTQMDGTFTHHPGLENVVVIDRRGAGDAYVGTLAYCTSGGIPLADSCKLANYVAQTSIQKEGQQSSFPTGETISFF